MTIYSGHSHSFDVGIAKVLGMNAAVIFNHIVYWLRINTSKGTEHNIRDGKVWMYESQQEISNFLEYLTIDDVKKAMVKLVDSGLLIKGNYNENPFDKTNWYTTADQSIIKKVLTKVPNGTIGSAKRHDPESHTAPSHYIQQEHIHKDKEQQQREREPAEKSLTETAAASFQKQTFPAARTKTSGMYDFLEGVDIPDVDKRELTSRYDRNTVQNAIAWATHPETKLTKGLVQAIKWGCQNKPQVPKSKDDEITLNKAYAKRFDGVKVGSATVNVLNQCVEIEYGTPHKPVTALSYEEKGFREQLDSALRKIGYRK